jgi:hypothetical protein
MVSRIGKDVTVTILSFLDQGAVCRAVGTCQAWYLVKGTARLWREIDLYDDIPIAHGLRLIKWAGQELKVLRLSGPFLDPAVWAEIRSLLLCAPNQVRLDQLHLQYANAPGPKEPSQGPIPLQIRYEFDDVWELLKQTKTRVFSMSHLDVSLNLEQLNRMCQQLPDLLDFNGATRLQKPCGNDHLWQDSLGLTMSSWGWECKTCHRIDCYVCAASTRLLCLPSEFPFQKWGFPNVGSTADQVLCPMCSTLLHLP